MYKYCIGGNTLTKYKNLGGVSMRRESRRHEDDGMGKNILYIGGSIFAIGIIAFVITFVLYGNKMEEQSNLGASKIAELMQEAEQQAQSASTQMGKTVEESKNDISNNVNTNTTNTEKKTEKSATNTVTKKTTTKSETTTTKKATTSKTEQTKTKKETKQEETKKELTFIKPVEGEISKEYAQENLVYSETLEEWTTHLGVDIKAEKTTVVKASADGKIKSIKNDPRYGLTIIIEHQEGFETLYANLLTSEFVQVGEEVKQGQSIGTVGNTATFEILDEPHLHFEISKNNENINPSQYIK